MIKEHPKDYTLLLKGKSGISYHRSMDPLRMSLIIQMLPILLLDGLVREYGFMELKMIRFLSKQKGVLK